MDYAEFNALIRGLRSIRDRKNPGSRIRAGTDASAFHGRLGARVALLQSPILPTASSLYIKKRNSRALAIDKPHTCPSVVEESFNCIVPAEVIRNRPS
jgi:hypothetical protein